MLILSYNVRGLGGAPKLAALSRILDLKRPKVVALQETMTEGGRAKDTLKTHLRDWEMKTLDAEGHSRGLLTTWSPAIVCHNKNKFKDAIGTELEDLETGLIFYFLNLYAPFYDMKEL